MADSRGRLRNALCAGVVVFLALPIGLLVPQCAAEDGRRNPEEQYLTGLRARRLFALAEQHCLRRLADPALSSESRVELTVELSQCLTEHATYRSGQEQAELWQRAREVVTELVTAEPDAPGRELLLLQSAYVPAVHGTALRWQFELAPHDASLKQLAIAQLQLARDALRQAESTLIAAARDARSGTVKGKSAVTLGSARLRLLVVDARFHNAATSLDLARLLPFGIDRTAVLHAAETRLNELARSATYSSRRLESRLLLAVAARLGNDYPLAMATLDALSTADVPNAIRQQAAAETMRVELARGQPDAALSRLSEAVQAGGGVSDEMQCVGVEARVAARSAALQQGDVTLAEKLWDEAIRADSQIRGPWRARSAAILEMARSTDEYGPELAPLILTARSAQQHGDVAGALSAFGEAGGLARDAGRHELAATLEFARASLLLESGRYAAAEFEFLAVASRQPPAKQAAQAHLLAAYCRGKQWEALPTQANRESYAAMLDEHRARYRDQPTQVEAAWMLAAYQESRLQWTEALSLYEAIPADHARSEAARARIAVMYERVLGRLQQTGQPRDGWEDRAVAQLLQYVELMPLPPAPLSAGDAQVALSFGRIVLDHRAPDYDDADVLLDRVIASAQLVGRQAESDDQSSVDPLWPQFEQTAKQLRIVSLAGQDRLTEAREQLGTLTAADPQAALVVLDGLSDLSGSVRPERRGTLGALQLRAAEEVQRRRTELTPAGEQRLDFCLAQAYAAVGRPNDAAEAYRRLLARAPDDKLLLARAAAGIGRIGKPKALREAKALWRRLESLEKPGSAAWLTARLDVARCSLQLGEIDECRKLLGVTRVLYPELGGPELRQQFDELESSLKK